MGTILVWAKSGIREWEPFLFGQNLQLEKCQTILVLTFMIKREWNPFSYEGIADLENGLSFL